jgi:hypothetical protein
MHRSAVRVCATCAALLLNSIAYGQQTATPQTKAATWTLYMVTVPYKGAWTIASVAAFSTKDTAYADCSKAINQIEAIPGLRQLNSDAIKSEGSQQYLICLPATAGGSQSHSSGHSSDEGSGE